MALLLPVVKSLVNSSLQNCVKELTPDRKHFAFLNRVSTRFVKKHYKKVAVVGACSAVMYGAYKFYRDLEDWELQSSMGPNEISISKLVDIQVMPTEEIQDVLDANTEILIVKELEDVLEIDEPDNVWEQQPLVVVDEKDCVSMISNKHNARSRRERKRITLGFESHALRALVAKAKLAFPVPKDTEVQMQAINLFLYKECRKINLRVTDAARIIPQAVALAMVPTEAQISYDQLRKLPEIQQRYLRRQWTNTKAPLGVKMLQSIRSWVNTQ